MARADKKGIRSRTREKKAMGEGKGPVASLGQNKKKINKSWYKIGV